MRHDVMHSAYIRREMALHDDFWDFGPPQYNKVKENTQMTDTPAPETQFNRAQLITYEDAVVLRDMINKTPLYTGQLLGGGVKPFTADPDKSGIYRPLWLPGPGSFPEPHYTRPEDGLTEYGYLFRFNNGADGVNAGLIRDKFTRYPTSPGYVLNSFAEEINMLGAASEQAS